jgi:hypothetical protein
VRAHAHVNRQLHRPRTAAPGPPVPLPRSAVALRPDLFEGMRFEITRPLNQNFFLTHRCVPVLCRCSA